VTAMIKVAISHHVVLACRGIELNSGSRMRWTRRRYSPEHAIVVASIRTVESESFPRPLRRIHEHSRFNGRAGPVSVSRLATPVSLCTSPAKEFAPLRLWLAVILIDSSTGILFHDKRLPYDATQGMNTWLLEQQSHAAECRCTSTCLTSLLTQPELALFVSESLTFLCRGIAKIAERYA
jgi:hypothetical protein